MNRLPNYKQARIDDEKLENYCLNPEHPVGKHKARVFQSALNLERENADLLKQKILKALPESEATKGVSDNYGNRYIVNMKIRIFEKEAELCTIWMIKSGEDFPRLITCYIQS